jgi:hypothetical protein
MFHRDWSRLTLLTLAALAALRPAPLEAGEVVRLLPADAEVAFSCNVRQLVEAPILFKMALVPGVAGDFKKLVWDRPLRKQIQMLGLDILSDITRITVAGRVGSDPVRMVDGLVVLEGAFKAPPIKASAQEAAKKTGGAFKVSTVNGVEVWELSSQANGAERVHVAVLNPTTLLLAESKTVMERAIDQAADKKKSGLDDWLRTTLEKADPKQSITCGFTPAGLIKVLSEARLPIQIRLTLPRNRRLARESLALSVGITFGEDLKITVGLNTRNAETARRLRRRIDRLGLIGAVVVSSVQDERLQTWEEILRSLRVKADGTTVFMQGQLAAATVEKVLKETHERKALAEKD